MARKLRAWEAGKPVPRYDTIHHAVVPADQTLIVVFVRMAGESRPWGIAWGRADEQPRIASVPDGRVRDDVAVLCADFAEDLLEHLRVHNWTYDPVDQSAVLAELRQVWLPNGQHVAMLHQLSYTYSQTKFGGVNQDILRALGRLAGWMFRDTSRHGHQHVVNASAALGKAYVFPTQDARTAHLGYQLAWLETSGNLAERMAAAGTAEGLTVSPTLDPRLERDELSPLVEKFQAGRREGANVSKLADAIAAVLASQLERRWRLTAAAYRLLLDNERPINAGVPALVAEAHDEFWNQHQRIELRHNDPSQGPAFVAHPETDFHGSSAASRYLIHAAADEAYTGHLIHDDAELFLEALDDGKALRGTVDSADDLGSGRTTKPQWVLRVDPTLPNRLRENGRIAPYGSKGHEATILSVESSAEALAVRIEWTGRKTMPLACGIGARPADLGWVGQEVAFVVSDAADLTRRRSGRVWKAKDGPGAWLTHGKAPVPVEITTEDPGADFLIDDISQIESETGA
ncbi:hypothetical protein ACFYE2_12465 [Kocuria sp. CPCC 205300]|uniref:hypothetical protein n=1 Tax=Kocuria sabuli TaxID=3071448 RepID=UPI0036DB82D0